MRIKLMEEDEKEASTAPRALRSSSVLNIDERPSTPTRMVKVLDTEATKNTPNRAVRNLSQSESKITPRRSRRISKSEEPEEFDINVLKAVKHSETIDEDSDEISDQDVKAVKKADPNTSLRLKLLSQAAKSHVDSPIPKATPRRSRRISKDESNDSLNNSKPISNVEPILEDAENVSDSDASSYSALKVPRRPRGRKISLDVDSPKRVTRRSSVTSDDESGKTGPTRATRGKRQSVAAPPTIDNITEETEDLNLSHELELRSRSVSRSPVVSQNDSASSSRPKQISPLALDNSSRIRRSDDGNKSVTFNETVPNDTATKMQYAKTPRKSTLLNEDESITILNTDSEDDDAEHIEKALTVKPVIRLSRYSFNMSKEEKREQEKLSKSLGAKFDEEDAFIFKEYRRSSKDLSESNNSMKTSPTEDIPDEAPDSPEEVPSSQTCITSPPATGDYAQRNITIQEGSDMDYTDKWMPDQTIQDDMPMEVEAKSPRKSIRRETNIHEEAMELSGNGSDMMEVNGTKASNIDLFHFEALTPQDANLKSDNDAMDETIIALNKTQSPLKSSKFKSPFKVLPIEDDVQAAVDMEDKSSSKSPRKSSRKSTAVLENEEETPEKSSPMKSIKNSPASKTPRKSFAFVEETPNNVLDDTIQSPEYSPVVKKTPMKFAQLESSPNKSPAKTPKSLVDELPKFATSWTQVVTGKTETNGIDSYGVAKESPIKEKAASPRKTPNKRVIVDSEDEYAEPELNNANGFLDDEAEENSDDSRTESEKLYIAENEIPNNGIDLGSEDTEDDEFEDEEHSIGSFICSDDENEQYSMDEDEKKLEFEPKRRSRIRQLSSSSDDAELKTKSSPQKRRSIHDNNVEQIENKKLQKNKRRLSSLMDNSTNMGDHKRPKMSDTLDHTAINIDCTWNSDNSKANLNATDVDIGALFNITQSESPLKSTKKDKKARKSLIQQEVVEEIQEMELDNKEAETVETRKTPKKVTNEAVSLDAIMSLCSEHMNKVEDQKKINKSIKNKKKEEKRKLKDADAALIGESEAKSGDETTLKKKKKRKAKKPQEIEEADKPSGVSEMLKSHEEVLERRRMKKKEKKLAKALKKEQEASTAPPATAAIEPATVEEPEKKKKKKKYIELPVEASQIPQITEKILVDVPEKKKKKRSSSEVFAVPEIVDEVTTPVSEKKKKKNKEKSAVTDEVSSPEAKHNKENETSSSKKKKSKSENSSVQESALETPNGLSAQNNNTGKESVSKRKKRNHAETVFNDEQELQEDEDVEMTSKKTKMVSKKLNVLGQLEASGGSTMSFQEEPRTPEQRSKFGFKEGPKTPIPIGFKVKNMVPKVLADRIEKKKKKRSMKRKTYDEVKHTLPKPVFSTVSGLWMEESLEIAVASSSSSTKFSVAPLVAKKNLSALGNVNVPAAFNFRSKALSREMNVRDNSNKKTAQHIFKQSK